MLNIVLFGPPGAGKGTQSQMLIEKFKLIHLSTGDILRNEIKNKTTLGLQAKELMDNGKLIPDDVVINMIKSILEKNVNSTGFIFFGFSRTQEQALSLDQLLKHQNTSISAMVSLKVDDKELIKRLLSRGKDSGRADDQSTEIIANRIEEYNNKTAPLKLYYKNQSKLHEISGLGSIDEITIRLNSVINSL